MNIVLWVLQILFAGLFMLHAVLHLFPSPRLREILAEQDIPVKRMIANWAEVVASLGLILPGAVGIATWLTPLAALGLAGLMVGAAAFHMSRKETLATVATASIALIMIFLTCGRAFVVPFH
jgi:DoxX-like family